MNVVNIAPVNTKMLIWPLAVMFNEQDVKNFSNSQTHDFYVNECACLTVIQI